MLGSADAVLLLLPKLIQPQPAALLARQPKETEPPEPADAVPQLAQLGRQPLDRLLAVVAAMERHLRTAKNDAPTGREAASEYSGAASAAAPPLKDSVAALKDSAAAPLKDSAPALKDSAAAALQDSAERFCCKILR